MTLQSSKGSFTDRFKSRKSIIIAIIGIIFLCCIVTLIIGLIITSTPTGKATSTARAEIQLATQTEKARPTNTPFPSNTALPTATPLPTNTRTPTYTLGPTHTTAPTNTPTLTPTPIVFTGNGDAIVDVVKETGPALVRITGNASSRHFAVINYDANNEQIDLLVNTTDPYDGVRPLDFLDDRHTYRFEVKATGAWTIEIFPLSTIYKLQIPGEISGTGDFVFAITGGKPDTALITGNANSRHFAVMGYGSSVDLLVNTTDPYHGTVLLSSDLLIIEVDSESDWTISITTR